MVLSCDDHMFISFGAGCRSSNVKVHLQQHWSYFYWDPMDNKDWQRTADDNLTSLVELDETALLQNVKRRYLAGKIYTDVGDILLAVNPFKTMPIYSEQWSQLYSRSQVDNLPPHVFGVASKAFNALLQAKKNQVCVISGESGAGKTESTKLIIQQVSPCSNSSQYIIAVVVVVVDV